MNKEPRDWSKVQRKKSPRQLNVRLSTDEMAELETTVQRLGVSKAGYAKSRIFGKPLPRGARRPTKASADMSQLLGLMGKLGSNANQIARLCNSGTITDHRDALDALQGIKGELSAMRVLLIKALDGEP